MGTFLYHYIKKSSGGDFCFNIYLFISAAWFRLKFVSFPDRLTCFLGAVCSIPAALLTALTCDVKPTFSQQQDKGQPPSPRLTGVLFTSPEHLKLTI